MNNDEHHEEQKKFISVKIEMSHGKSFIVCKIEKIKEDVFFICLNSFSSSRIDGMGKNSNKFLVAFL